MSEEVLENSDGKEKKTIPIRDFPLGIAPPKSGNVHFSARILRLISLRQLQEVQRKINETLVEIQNLTIDFGKKADLKQIQYGK
ncbi:unnamed protein product [Caenorhabditis angaria]|uniref:Uncharacterized protein n=1 Tax=Caenorhabditis angaria TaxID=860376 RepID=A0A9P1IF19_9PELO|nr:unnamed protein product [Caenorhabditis angaria]